VQARLSRPIFRPCLAAGFSLEDAASAQQLI
jgi:hypothetical protein